MRILLPLMVALLAIPAALNAQKLPMKFGKVPPEDLAMTRYAPDTGAAAVVLGDFGELKFHFTNDNVTYNFKRHRRIKVLKRAGFDQGDITIPYYSKNKWEDVKNIKALVITPDGKEADVSKREIFDERINDFFSQKRFTIPNLTEGCIIEYQYETICNSIFRLPTWDFQEEIPVRWSELRLEIPEWYNYTFISQGRKPDVTDSEATTENFYLPGGIGPSGTMEAKVNKVRWAMKDMPALKEEPFITTMDDYYARIRFQLSSISYPNTPVRNIMNSWDEVAKELWDDDDFGGQLKRKRNYSTAWGALQPHLGKANTPEEKCRAIYDFVQANVNPELGRGIFVKKDLNQCFEKKKGQHHEINLLLTALRREAGLEAWPVLLSNRDNGKMYPFYPFMDQFDHVIALVVIDGNHIFMDATAPYRPMGIVGENALNGAGWAVIEGKPKWITITPPATSETYLLNLSLNSEGGMSGNLTLSSTGYSAIDDREELAGSPSGEFFKKRISDRFPDARLDSLLFDGKDVYAKSFKATANCHLPSMVQSTGDFFYINPVLMSDFQKSPFKLEVRSFPVDIPYPIQERIILNLTLPEGFIVEELPEPANMAMPNEAGKFVFQISNRGNSLQVISNILVNRLRYETDEYPSLRDFFGLVEQKLGEQIVLKRKT